MKLSALIKTLTAIKDNMGDVNLMIMANGKPVNEDYIMYRYENQVSVIMDVHSDLTIVE